MKIINLDQQSPDWLFWRKGGIGGSDAPAIMGVSPWQTYEGLLKHKATHRGGFERKTNGKKSEAMLAGIRNEPMIRDLYCDLQNIKVVPQCVVHDIYDWFRASLDGLSENHKLVVEIKAPFSNYLDHELALTGQVPTKYWPQVQHQLGVTGCKLLHYVSYFKNDRYRKEQWMAVVPVRPSEEYIRDLIHREKTFLNDLAKLIGQTHNSTV